MNMVKKKSLVEITEEEFVTIFWKAIDDYDNQISHLQNVQRDFYKLWRDYSIDKCNTKNNLIFYLRDGSTLFYKKTIKPSIGYKRCGEK